MKIFQKIKQVFFSIVAFGALGLLASVPAYATFSQCPAIGADSGCGILITFNADGSTTVTSDPSQPPFDNIEDTLIGVQNNTGVTISSTTISGPGIFALDGDGLCSAVISPKPAGCPFGPTTYEGPNTSFTISDSSNGTVTFPSGLPAGGSAYFSLEGKLSASSISLPTTTTTYTGPKTQDFNDPVTLSAHLVDKNGAPISGATINFSLSTQTCSGTTDASGNASCSILPNEAAGSYTVTATYPGDSNHKGSSDSATFTVTLEETTTTYTGPTNIAQGQPVTAVLKEDGTTGISGRTVTLSLATGENCSGTTDGTGNVSCTLSGYPLGPNTITASFAGDAFYKASSDSKPVLIFANLSSGSFVLGDVTVSTATPTTDVEWWGAQWAKLNTLSGGSAPNAFKGFADTLSSSPATCGGTWTTDPGNSSKPPASVPSYMSVIVSSSISKSGSLISGDIPKIVVVKTDPGYADNPGHAGTGTIVGIVCK